MNKIILNDSTVAQAIANHNAEIKELKAVPTREESLKYVQGLDNYDVSKFLPEGTVAGDIHRAKKQGVPQSYGFIGSSEGDVFVPPSLMSEFEDGERVACMVRDTPRGLSAEKIAGLKDFISWHAEEISGKAMLYIYDQRKEKLEWYGKCDPSNGWEEMKAKCKTLGLELIEVRKETKTFNYGGHGNDTYLFSKAVTHEEAERVLDILGTRHAERDNGCPYDHGHDDILITADIDGFVNTWSGPFTD